MSRYRCVCRYVATLVPLISVVITAIALIVQVHETNRTSEDSKWQDSMKSVSFKDPKEALVGALAMRAFFDSPRYGAQSRQIASALLPIVNNVNGFDEILQSMMDHTDARNQVDITSVSQGLLMTALYRDRVNIPLWTSSTEVPAFLAHDVALIDFDPDYQTEGPAMRDTVTAWELDTVSQVLQKIWTDKNIRPFPRLRNVVLENASFATVNFSGANLRNSIIYDADLSRAVLKGANLADASIRDVNLYCADLSDVAGSSFQGSTWVGTRWWQAKAISPDLKTYLAQRYPPRDATSCSN